MARTRTTNYDDRSEGDEREFEEPAVTLTQAELQHMINSSVAAALAAAENRRASTGGNEGNQNVKVASYKDFQNCRNTKFGGTEGPVGLLDWLNELESNFSITATAEADRVKFAASVLEGDALGWWNAHKAAVGVEAADATPWNQFKGMLDTKYCGPAQRMEMEAEFWQLRVKANDIQAYDVRFLQLCNFCPDAVTPESRKIQRYIYGLPGSIQASTTAARLETIGEVMKFANDLILQVIRRNAWKEEKSSGNKRKEVENSGKAVDTQPRKKMNGEPRTTLVKRRVLDSRGTSRCASDARSIIPDFVT